MILKLSKYIPDKQQENLRVLAENMVLDSSRFTFYMGKTIFPKNKREVFYYWYAYLRRVDDEIDEGTENIDNKVDLIEYHQQLVKQVYLNPVGVYPNQLTANLLLGLVRNDCGKRLRDPVMDMLEAIKHDCLSPSGPHTWQEFMDFASIEVKAYLEAFLYFCSPKNTMLDGEAIGINAGIAAKICHNLRDLKKDHNRGCFNIPHEERMLYGIRDGLEPTVAVIRWACDKRTLAKRLFEDGKSELARSKVPLRFKLCFALLCAKYEDYLRYSPAELINNERYKSDKKGLLVLLQVFVVTFIKITLCGKLR